MATFYTKTISSNAINTNFKENILVSGGGTLYNIYPLGKPGKRCNLAFDASTSVSCSAGNIKTTSNKTMVQYSSLNLEVEPTGTYWVPVGGYSKNA